MDISEEQIIALMRDPESREKGFTLLMGTWKEKIYWHIRRLVVSHEDAEDILQETFVNVYLYFGSFNGKSRLYTWLYRIATNESVKLFRKRQKKVIIKVSPTETVSMAIAVEDIDGSEHILEKFQQAIRQLPEKQRLVFNLRYYDELNYEEISQILDTSVASLKTSYHYACEKLKKYMINN